MTDPSEDLSPETRALLDHGRHGHALDAGRRSGLRRAVLAQVAAGSVLATTTTAAAWTTSAINAASVAVLVVFAGGSLHAIVTRDEPARGVTHESRQTATANGRAATPPAKPTQRSVEARGTEAAERGAPAVAPVALEAPVAPAPPPLPTSPLSTPAPAPARPALAPRSLPAPSPAAPSALRADAPLAGKGSIAPALSTPEPALPEASQPAPAAPAASSLAAEAQLLREADRALKAGDVAGCLRLLDEHARQFPGGVLEPERSAERVLALCAAGRDVEAERAARTFLASHEPGPLASRVRASCVGGGL